ncbi:2-keto-3-deoxy-L-rhamnonate aldolase RhmA [Erythromicrobium ramosum]|uniref:Aldolase n=1 Tax=Erythrobacter ramosus TaxID=35811 RepID=A0A6I4UJ82_9SPHN|nr:2-keto-3-deoxy-L-rhamnonate aldolase RhmA [Erythrobacter ramosus]MXP37373.1 aldolase [Erythrobacter ramosus]
MSDFKTRLASGAPLLGTFVKTPHPHVVEVLAGTGLDCLCLDAEHAPFDRRDLDAGIMAARAGGMPVLVRPASSAAHEILNALDCGADGVLVPHVRSAAEAEAVAASVHYGPGGGPARRGYAGSSRAAGYGTRAIPDHLDASAATSVVIAQIEDLEALDEIDAIAAVPGIDALFIGRIDLTIALGCASPDDPKVIAAVERILAACRTAGRACGMFTPRPVDVPHWQAQGASLFLLGSDHGFLREGAANLARAAGFAQ